MLRPRRRNVPPGDFADLCATLAARVSSFDPDAVVGIETGGARVAEAMLPHLRTTTYAAVRLQRPATAVKSGMRLDRVVAGLPQVATDGLRWVEVEAREVWSRLRPSGVSTAAAEAASVELRPHLPGARRVLVVDDTVDSGRTLSTIVSAARLACPGAEVRTAVLTSTWRRPPVQPDFSLFERTLLRLPWSFDAVPQP